MNKKDDETMLEPKNYCPVGKSPWRDQQLRDLPLFYRLTAEISCWAKTLVTAVSYHLLHFCFTLFYKSFYHMLVPKDVTAASFSKSSVNQELTPSLSITGFTSLLNNGSFLIEVLGIDSFGKSLHWPVFSLLATLSIPSLFLVYWVSKLFCKSMKPECW